MPAAGSLATYSLNYQTRSASDIAPSENVYLVKYVALDWGLVLHGVVFCLFALLIVSVMGDVKKSLEQVPRRYAPVLM